MVKNSPETLWEALDTLRPSEVFRLDLLLASAGGGGALWLALAMPDQISAVMPVAAAFVGIVVGAVVASVALVAAFMDRGFLRKLQLINRDPIRYLTPLLATALLGILAAMSLLLISATPPSAPAVWRGAIAFVTGLFVFWTLTSLVSNLSLLVGFVRLQEIAARVTNEDVIPLAGNGPDAEAEG